ncbi:MAG TPA: metallophosphoesterase family protein [bacterium]|nr:metallophosphoesterase family protein [bacterium]
MRYAVISDIHANLEALSVVLEDIRSQNCDATLCLGDVVGYGANPNECVQIVFEQCRPILEVGLPIVKGNHDEAVTSGNARDFNDAAAAAARWTRETLECENAKRIADLPMTVMLDDVFLVHASPFEPERWHYVLSVVSAFEAIDHFPESTRVCFIGHSHCPSVMCQNERGDVLRVSGSLVSLEDQKRYLINVGSVGQPRDSDPRASYAVYDTESKTVEIRRLQYDIPTAQRKIEDAGLPGSLARRLAFGR